RLAKILTDEQRELLNEVSRQRPGGPPDMLPRVAPPEGGRAAENPPPGRPRNARPAREPRDPPPPER
ncbi:MAG TPA: hypothetical protein VG125_01165, partial [Pirellulales bacterium]|nr:hypothetical protein [Pirellulales bacterium]